ncbi:hypothetical protein SVIOM342S_08676 [Streptomyces violaceorubidus]
MAYSEPSVGGHAQVNVIPDGPGTDEFRRSGRGLPHVDAVTPAVLVLPGPVSRGETPRYCDEVRALLESARAGVVVCDVGGLGPPGLAVVDLLARLQLTARQAGGRIRLRDPDPALHALLDLVGLRFETERAR